ncbi:MAG: response regulator transcription factor [Spirochaetaceae bacterium]|jgi:DNA-binding response OmpR family regulator|nr:response regulator transcription factor [Spirochaetaceae bacterium]
MNKRSILVVDDEVKILNLLKSYLEANGYGVVCARNGREGLEVFDSFRRRGQFISLILLDLMLPDFSGEEFCGRVRRYSGVPIIMITAKVDEESIIRGLNTGADDYVCKPFSPRQLMARIEAALRRSGGTALADGGGGIIGTGAGIEAGMAVETSLASLAVEAGAGSEKGAGIEKGLDCFRCGDLVVDTEKRTVRRNGEFIPLTRDEYKLLTLLMSSPAKIFTRDEILDAVKGDDYDGFDRSVDSHIKRLRSKIGDDKKSPKYILTVYGMGYRIGSS